MADNGKKKIMKKERALDKEKKTPKSVKKDQDRKDFKSKY